MDVEADFLVIGSGLAGLTYALNASARGSVALLTKKTRSDANSSWAQGGIAGVLAEDDSVELHKQDTLVAGAGLCNEEAVDVLVREGPERIHDLIRMGAEFNREIDSIGLEGLSLGREGGHSRNRIVHTADYTGWECEKTLLEAVKANPRIVVHEHLFVTDLVVADSAQGRHCLGARTLHGSTGETITFRSQATLLATGGCGQVYQHTTNPLVATGDGVAMAWRSGARMANLEFIQFHPTTLFHPDARAFLITEALRGEGGILCHEDGERFMQNYHPLEELAPRDIVARAIVSEIQKKSVPCVYLDVRHLGADFLKEHFPTVYERCLSVGINIATQPIPIVPAQHYQCGGVITDLDGRTNIARLYAAGEVACTGVHGANRLASNSLLEAMVFGYRAAKHTLTHACSPIPGRIQIIEPPANGKVPADSERIAGWMHQVRRQMRKRVGIVRSTAELEIARKELSMIWEQIQSATCNSVEGWEVRNICQVGQLIVAFALKRHESRGLHYTLDYPESVDSERHDTILSPDDTEWNRS